MDVNTVVCPKCGFKSKCLDDWDIIGACNDNLFCQLCHCEFDPGTGEIHKCDMDAEQASTNRSRGIRCAGVRERGRRKK